MFTAPGGAHRAALLTDAVTDETLGTRVYCAGSQNIVIYISGSGTTSSGVITIEEADWDPSTAQDYTGTWSTIQTVNASDVSGGAQKAIHLSQGCYAWVRARVSTVIGGGGTVSAVLRSC